MAGFPRMLFYGGVAGEPRLVHSDEEGAQAHAEGWLTFGETPEAEQRPEAVADRLDEVAASQPKRRGRPPKARA